MIWSDWMRKSGRGSEEIREGGGYDGQMRLKILITRGHLSKWVFFVFLFLSIVLVIGWSLQRDIFSFALARTASSVLSSFTAIICSVLCWLNSDV